MRVFEQPLWGVNAGVRELPGQADVSAIGYRTIGYGR